MSISYHNYCVNGREENAYPVICVVTGNSKKNSIVQVDMEKNVKKYIDILAAFDI